MLITLIRLLSLATLPLACTHCDEYRMRMPDSKEINAISKSEYFDKFANYCSAEMADIKEKIKSQEKSGNLNNLFYEFNIATLSGIQVSATYFDRKSEFLVVAGQGFNHSKKSVHTLASLYPNYDVVAFNYRWTNMLRFVCKMSTIFNPIEELFLKEHEEVEAVVSYMKKKKKYSSVIGHALCYSTYPFLDAQAKSFPNKEPLFDKLILDSTFLTTDEIVEKITHQPLLIYNSQIDYTPSWLQTILKYLYIPRCAQFLIKRYSVASIPNLLNTIKDTPILFIHGKNDILVPVTDMFEAIWNATSEKNRFAYLTPHEHVMNLPKNRGLYRKVCELFIDCSPDMFRQQFPLTFD